jgi:hypothetical protein
MQSFQCNILMSGERAAPAVWVPVALSPLTVLEGRMASSKKDAKATRRESTEESLRIWNLPRWFLRMHGQGFSIALKASLVYDHGACVHGCRHRRTRPHTPVFELMHGVVVQVVEEP